MLLFTGEEQLFLRFFFPPFGLLFLFCFFFGMLTEGGLVQVGVAGITAAWAGGVNGREVIDRFLPQVPLALTDTGILYMVVIKENLLGGNLDSMLDLLPGFQGEIILSRRAGPERLSIAKFWRLQ
eukprot:m.73682 g.73682  ORF g.73682 m.73682 type:complete len:125 (-) comp13910_c0_seq1:171-545(-)